jgi:hypothetical protein
MDEVAPPRICLDQQALENLPAVYLKLAENTQFFVSNVMIVMKLRGCPKGSINYVHLNGTSRGDSTSTSARASG